MAARAQDSEILRGEVVSKQAYYGLARYRGVSAAAAVCTAGVGRVHAVLILVVRGCIPVRCNALS